ncbi:pyruvate kinase [Dictyobacter alpinus]|uniref:Pyruvate kinase n=1 Tax=Dictyobacter alpinus TaxID=2014873 RepID=A0A402BA14_9CHLR|nr:pyruvate kinase [Dictyobacter alpinus]GCE28218.1 pyruvate kinase [Dictyobacter alpinus]
MRRTKIVCTIGPATNSDEQLEKLMLAGMNVARLNFSHGTQEGHAKVIESVRSISKRLNIPVAILQDLQGPKIRTGLLRDGQPVRLVDGAQLTITSREVVGTSECVATTYKQLPQDVKIGDRILLDDGLLELRVIDKNATDVHCEIVHGGLLKEHKGINLPGVAVSAPSLTEKDLADLRFGVQHGVDYVALSFVRRPEDILSARQQIEAIQSELGCETAYGPIPLIAKLEKPEAVKRLDEILRVTDGVMVARGDLGVEMAPESVPLIQKHIISRCNDLDLPVITATQMLESMISNPRPTRAEASDVANAIFDGTDAVMLSAETAAGSYPIEAVKMMDRIARQTESEGLMNYQRHVPLLTQDRAVCHAAKALAEEASVKYIAVFTRSGTSAQLVSKDRPRTPIMAYTPSKEVYHRLCLWWGVWPHIIPLTGSTEELIEIVEKKLQAEHEILPGDSIVIMGGMPVASRMRTNFVRLHHIGELG